MSNIVRAIRTRALLDNLSTGDSRWSSLIGCEMIHPQHGRGTIQDVKAVEFRDAIFGVKWLSGKVSTVSTASFINGKVSRLLVPEGLGIPPQLAKWVRNEESDQARKQRVAAERVDPAAHRRAGRLTKTSLA